MLTQLTIRNIVLIEHCELHFAGGLCVLTGETGAGKSILLDSLGLVLGARADARLVRHGAADASVNAVFEIQNQPALTAILSQLELPNEETLIIRRTLTADGKTKCFVNDTAISVAGLKTIGDALIEINGQHDGRGLLDTATHSGTLDEYGQHEALLAATQLAYQAWKDTLARLQETKDAAMQAAREKEYLEHMCNELVQLAPEPDEEITLADARTLMMQSEKLAEMLHDVGEELAQGKGAASMIHSAQRILARSNLNTGERFTAAIEAFERALSELAEAEQAVEKLAAEAEYNPAKLEQMEERLFALRAAARKYSVPVNELVTLRQETQQKLALLANQAHAIAAIEKEALLHKAAYITAAEALSEARKKTARKLEKSVLKELALVKMESTQFTTLCEPLPEERWHAGGMESVQFQASTNKGSSLAPLHKIASGGELSRFMLAMKVALAHVKSTPTLIFDEIDTGTGGAVADAIGHRLAALGKTHQVLVVTHLPQVAARGDHHLHVMKEVVSGKTFTRVQQLVAQDRTEELARMLAGAEITKEARKAAEKLLQAAG